MSELDSLRQEMDQCRVVERVAGVPIRTPHGEFLMAAFAVSDSKSMTQHVALYRSLDVGEPDRAITVRINSACLTGDVFGCDRCDCKWQLDESLRRIALADAGLLIYSQDEEGRGLGLVNKVRSYSLMDSGLSTTQSFRRLGMPDDKRRFLPSVLLLREFGVRRVNLLTNNPKKVQVLQAFGIAVVGVTPLVMPSSDPKVLQYLRSKRDEMGHVIPGGI